MREKKSWLHGAVGYEIYSRSFQDSTGDGFGDLPGITERLDHLAWLGVDLVWLTPIYPSPDHDHGYDVADYRTIRAEHGTFADLDALLGKAHSLGLKVLLDFVPNHTSSEHEWFKKALADPSSPERDMYIFRDPAPDGGPPNNWISHFGGSAWTLDETSGQYYLHLFLPEQPDLNWRNPDVLNEFDDIYRFWFDKGIDGFRIDVAAGLLKDPEFRDIEQVREFDDDAGPLERFMAFDHKYDMDQDQNIELFARWQAIADEYDATLLAEAGLDRFDRLIRYVGPDALDLAFYLEPGFWGWEPELFAQKLVELAEMEQYGIAWTISNHDQPRAVSRFSDDPVIGGRRALAVTTLQMSLGGVPFLYYGEELGLTSGIVDSSAREDPIVTQNTSDGGEGRDVARTPMPWDSSACNGFSTTNPWISCNERPIHETVEAQKVDITSPMHRYLRLIQARHRHPDLYEAPLEQLDSPSAEVAVLRRGAMLIVANLSAWSVTIEGVGSEWEEIFTSDDSNVSTVDDSVIVGPECTAILRDLSLVQAS